MRRFAGNPHALIRPVIGVLFLAAAGFSHPSGAIAQNGVDFSVSGEYRARSYFFNHFLAGGETGDKNLTYLQHRFEVGPKIRLGDEAEINVELSLLGDRVWGEDGLPAFAETNDADGVNIALDRVWGEIQFPFLAARVSVGRMGFDWGRGILFNSGEPVAGEWGDPFYGDTYDQVLVDARPIDETSDLHVLVAIGKLSEGGEEYWYGSENDDIDQYLAGIVYDTSFLRAGVLLVEHNQSSTSTNLITGDAHAMIDLIRFRSDLELVYRYGETEGIPNYSYLEGVEYPGKTIHQFGWSWEMRIMGLGVSALEDVIFEFGGASGDSQPDDWNVTAFTFDPDYNVSLLLFQELMRRRSEAEYASWTESFEGAAPSILGLSADEIEEVTSVWSARMRTRGGVSNAVYLKPSFSFTVPTLESLEVMLAFLWARARVGSDADGDGKGNYNLGAEFDLGARYVLGEHAEVGVQMGYLIAGDYFDYLGSGNAVRQAVPVSTVQGRFTIRF